ncbi:MAG: CRISPR-associated protein Cas4 [Anaerolinea sp.]|nr:CRISPR-associated protein Cas4 [Anaerolinea sp.]
MIGLFLGLLILALLLFWLGQRQQRSAGLPEGRILYSDMDVGSKPERPFYDPELGLTGKPDYLVQSGQDLLPVEVKSSDAPSEPYQSHIMQLMAYCYLVARSTGRRPPYGILRYRNRSFAIDYSAAREEQLLAQIAEMRRLERSGKAMRSHEEPRRCARCGYARHCPQKL